ncbi:MAG: hypothetical protein ACLFP4_17195 [Spirochaetales bacterium]
MKKKSIDWVLLLEVVVIAFVALGFASCSNAGAGGDAAYFVSFRIGDTDYVLTEGYTEDNVFDAGANGSLSSGGGDRIRIAAVSPTVSDMDTEGPFIFLSVTGTAEGTYGADDLFVGTVLETNDDYYLPDTASEDAFTVTIRSIADSIGENFEGTFSGTLTDSSDGEIVIENGSFVVERLSDGALSPPGRFQ